MPFLLSLLASALTVGCGGGACQGEPERVRSAPVAPPDESHAPPKNVAPEPEFVPPGPDGFGHAAGLRYLERCLGCADPEARVPMLVMIHGLGDAPRHDWFEGAEDVDPPLRMVLPQAPTPYHGGFAWFPYRVGDRNVEALARGIAIAAEQLARFLEVMRTARPTRGLPIVSGFSQGGMLSYALALHHPAVVALSHPMAGLLPEPLWPKSRAADVRYPRIVALHGDADDVVGINEARKLTAHLKRLGFDVELHEFAGIRHTVSAAMNAQTVELVGQAARVLGAEP
jgi:phospholipase/carboxylesterase